MPKSEIDQLRQQLNDMRRRHPTDPYLGERINQIRENLALLQEGVGGLLLLDQCVINVVGLDQYMKAKREE